MQEKSKHFAWALARVMVEIPSQSFHHSVPLTLTICIQRGLNPVRCQIPGLVAHCASENTFLCLSFFTVPASGLRLLRARHCLSYIIHLFHIWHMFLQIVCSWVKIRPFNQFLESLLRSLHAITLTAIHASLTRKGASLEEIEEENCNRMEKYPELSSPPSRKLLTCIQRPAMKICAV